MDMPTAETSADPYLPRSSYTVSRVAADPKTVGLERGLDAAHGNIKTALRERDDLEEQAQKKAALLDYADASCDDDVEGFELHLLAAVQKNRDNPKYRRYFSSGLRDVTMAEPRKEEPDMISDMLSAMAADENDPDIGAVVAQWKSKLTASREKVVAIDVELTACEKALTFLKEKTLPGLMAVWREEYKKTEGALLTVYASDSKRVARFFKPFRKNRKVSKPQTPPAPSTPATPATTP